MNIAENKTALKQIVCATGLVLYVVLLIGVTMLNRTPQKDYQIEFVPFWSYVEVVQKKDFGLLRQIIGNVLVFIPWPILFAAVFPAMRKFRLAVGSAFLFSAIVEITQLVFRIGLYEFDDMFHNVLGAAIGYGIWMFYRRHNKKGVEE